MSARRPQPQARTLVTGVRVGRDGCFPKFVRATRNAGPVGITSLYHYAVPQLVVENDLKQKTTDTLRLPLLIRCSMHRFVLSFVSCSVAPPPLSCVQGYQLLPLSRRFLHHKDFFPRHRLRTTKNVGVVFWKEVRECDKTLLSPQL